MSPTLLAALLHRRTAARAFGCTPLALLHADINAYTYTEVTP